MKWTKYIPPLLIAGFALFLYLTVNNGSGGGGLPSEGISFRDFLGSSHVQAETASKAILPDSLEKIRPYVEETLTGSGIWIPEETYTPEDSLEVEISEIENINGEKWVRVEIGGKPVVWRKLEHFEREPKEDRPSFHFVPLAYTNCEGAPLGIGIAWTPVDIWNFDIGISATAELDPSPRWASLQGRISHHIGESHVSVGVNGGYRIGLNPGEMISIDVSLDI